MDTLWQIRDPDPGWYEHMFVDGEVRNAVELPLVECPECSSVHISDRILPFVCPPEIREEAEALDEARSQGEGSVTVPLEKFRRYAARWEAALRRYGHEVKLLPGDAFSPRLWRVPSIPRYDIFWPSIGHTAVVSERIARLLQENQVSGISLRPVVLEKVGAVEPTDQVPEILDMSDYFKQAETLDNPSQCGNFFELLISHSTLPSPDDGVTIIPGCSACGRIESWEESIAYKKQIAFYRKKKILPRRYALDADVFRSHIFQGFVVSPKVYALVSEGDLRNCRIDRLAVCDDPTAG